MALQATSAVWPAMWLPWWNLSPSLNVMDAADEKVAFIFQCPKAGNLNSVGFRLSTVTQAPSNGLKVSFQDIDTTTGHPDGTPDQYCTVTTGLTANTWVDVSATGYMGSTGGGSGTKRTVAKGDWLAVVIEFASFNVSDSLQISGIVLGTSFGIGRAYVDIYTGAWAKNTNFWPCLSLKYDDGTYAPILGVLPILTVANQTIGNATDPDEAALYFQVPFTCKVDGALFCADADGDVDIVLYDSDGSTVLASGSLDKDVRNLTSTGNHIVQFTAEATLAVGTNYRLCYKPTSATTGELKYFTVSAAALLDQMEGGQNVHWSQRTNAGAWAQTTTQRPIMAILISALDDGAGAAGGGLPILGGSVVR